MLVLSRKEFEQVIITVPPTTVPTRIVVRVDEILPQRTRIGFVAPEHVLIHREEVQDILDREGL